jgi:hypothetical protein
MRAEFYRRLLGLRYRPGDEPTATGEPDTVGQDWLVLRDAAGSGRLAFQQVAALRPAARRSLRRSRGAARCLRRPCRTSVLSLRGQLGRRLNRAAG